MREIKLSEELDRYNTKLFPPQYHYKYFPYKYRLIVDGERWEESVALKSDDRISALLWGDVVKKVENLPLAELAVHFSDLELALSENRESPFSWAFDFMELRCTKRDAQSMTQVVFKIDQDFNYWSAPFSISDPAAAYGGRDPIPSRTGVFLLAARTRDPKGLWDIDPRVRKRLSRKRTVYFEPCRLREPC